MKNKIIAAAFGCFALLNAYLSPAPLFAQSKYDKALSKADVAYGIGDYKGAKKALEKAKKKINSKLGAQNCRATARPGSRRAGSR